MNERTLEKWEQGRAKPNSQAAVLLLLVRHFPDSLEPFATNSESRPGKTQDPPCQWLISTIDAQKNGPNQFSPPDTRRKSIATNSLPLTREENPSRPILFSCHEKKIHRDQFSSPATRKKSIATNSLLLPQEENPSRPILFSCRKKKIHRDQFSSVTSHVLLPRYSRHKTLR